MDEILENLFTMDAMGGKTILRCILLKGINDNKEHFENLKNIYKKLKNCSHIELFSYHHYGEGKYTALGKQYHGKKEWIVDNKQLKSVASYFKKHQIPCKINV